MSERSVGAVIGELRQMIVTYIKQETTAPLRGAFRYVRLGLIGGLIAVVAAVFTAVGGLRVAQTADVMDIDRGAWSWLVYLVVGLVAIGVGALFVMIGVRGRRAE